MSKHDEEYFYKEGCFIEEWLNDVSHAEMSIAHVRVEPEQTTQLHALKNTTERYIMLEGSARVTVGDDEWHVAAKDVVTIQPGIAQRIQNLQKSDLVFLAICNPRFEVANYIDLENP